MAYSTKFPEPTYVELLAEVGVDSPRYRPIGTYSAVWNVLYLELCSLPLPCLMTVDAETLLLRVSIKTIQTLTFSSTMGTWILVHE